MLKSNISQDYFVNLRFILIRYIKNFCKRANFAQAKAITDYRRLKGPLHSLQDLRLQKDFTPEAIQRLEPYVEF